MGTRANPVPLQFVALRKEDFQSESGIAAFNLQLQQIVNALNEGNGSVSRVSLPHGVDVRGSTISNVGDPKNPTDAVSQGHVSTNYGAPTLRPQLDIGGKETLKGLSYLYGWQQTNQAAVATIPQTYSGQQSFTLFGLVIKIGHSGTIPSGSPGLVVTFTNPFPTQLESAVAVDDFAAGGTRNISVVAASSNQNQLLLWSDGAGAGAFWIATGY